MRYTVKFLRIVGGKNDGDVQKLREPLVVEKSPIREIWCGDECFHVESIEHDTAVLVLDINP